MLTNKTIEIIRVCMNTTLAIIRKDTNETEKSRQDIKNAISEFNNYAYGLENEADKESNSQNKGCEIIG